MRRHFPKLQVAAIALIIALITIAGIVWKTQPSQLQPNVVGTPPASDEASKAASRAMTFTEPAELKK